MTTADPPALGSRPGSGGWGHRARAVALSTPFLAVVVALAAWPTLSTDPGVGIDTSWQVALQMATHRGLDWGTQVVFSYGPLGYLATPLTMYGALSATSALYVVAVVIGLGAAYLSAARLGGLHVAVAFAIALVAVYTSATDVVVPIVLVCCGLAIGRDPVPRATPFVVYGGGALVAVESLVKLNSGLAVAAVVVLTVIAVPGPRRFNLAKFAVTAVATFAVLWFATGQGVGNLADYFTTSFQIVSGYSAAMMASGAPDWTIWAALGLLSATLVSCVVATRGLPAPRRLALLLATAIVAFVGWKEGFVRHDSGHMAIFFIWMQAPWVGVVVTRGGRWRWLGLAGFVATVTLYFAADSFRPGERLNPLDNASDAITQVHDLLDPAARTRAREGTRFSNVLAYRVDPKTVHLIGNKPIDIYPWNTSLAWTLGFNWDPEPVFQEYSAYTPSLDDLNADALSSPDGPRLILRHLTGFGGRGSQSTFGLEGRYVPYDTPAVTLAMICNFRPLRTTRKYELLSRTPDRCGSPRALRSVTARYGQGVRVPEPKRANEVIFARVHGLAPSGAERLWTLLYRAAFRYVVFDHDRAFRMVAANAGDGLILRAPPGIDYPAPFAMSPQARTLAFEVQNTVASPSGPLQIDFYEMPVRPYGGRPASGP